MKIIYLQLILICIVLCSCNSNSKLEDLDLESSIEKVEDENYILKNQISDLEDIIEAKKKEIVIYTIADETNYHGYGRIIEESELKVMPITTSGNSEILQSEDIVIILDECIMEDKSSWLLVKSIKMKIYGYIITDKVEIINIAPQVNESQWDIFGIKLGDSLNKAIFILGNSYTKVAPREYSFDEIAVFGVDNQKTEIYYNPISKEIVEMETNESKYKVNGLFGVGENVYESVNMITNEFIDYEEDNYVLIEDSSNQYIILYYDLAFNISKIIYRRNDIDA